jgi:hypothetical protein
MYRSDKNRKPNFSNLISLNLSKPKQLHARSAHAYSDFLIVEISPP